MIKGKPLSEALAVSNKAVVEALDGLPAHKLHCSVLAEEAIKAAIQDYYEKNGIEYDHSQFANCEPAPLRGMRSINQKKAPRLNQELRRLFYSVNRG